MLSFQRVNAWEGINYIYKKWVPCMKTQEVELKGWVIIEFWTYKYHYTKQAVSFLSATLIKVLTNIKHFPIFFEQFIKRKAFQKFFFAVLPNDGARGTKYVELCPILLINQIDQSG